MPPATLNKLIQDEIYRLTELHEISTDALEEFAQFIIANYKKKPQVEKPKQVKPLTLKQLKEAIYEHFEVKTTAELKKSGSFRMAADGMDDINFSSKESLEKLYRKFVGILPHEEEQEGYGCINGINIFNYFKPWQVFGLDSKTATKDDVHQAYRNLSKVYHPDVPNTGDSRIFDQINVMYKSIVAGA